MEKDARPLITPAPEYMVEFMRKVPERLTEFLLDLYQDCLAAAPNGYPKAMAENDGLSVVSETVADAIYLATGIMADVKEINAPLPELIEQIMLPEILRRLRALESANQKQDGLLQ